MVARCDWPSSTLGDFATLQRGLDLPVQDRLPGRVPVYGSNGIVAYHAKAPVQGPGVITGRSGSIGQVFYTPEAFWPLNTALYVRDFHGNDPRFAARLLEQLRLERFVAATGVPSLNRNFIHPLSVNVPPLPEQRGIAAILDTIDDAIRSTEQLIAKLKQVKQGLIHDLLTQGIDDNGELRDRERDAEQFKESPLGWIPRGWEAVRLHELADNHDGRRIPLKQSDRDARHGPYPYYGASGIIDWIDNFTFDGDFVLLGEDGENVVSRHLPLAFRVTGRIWVNNHAHVFSAKEGVDIRFLAELLESVDYAAIVSGSAQPKLTQTGLAGLWFARPPAEEQNGIADILETNARRTETEQRELAKLLLLKAGLMEDLLTGRVRVTKLLESAAE